MSFNDPIDHIVWRHVDDLRANFWNPNVVFNAELRLLEFSILKAGWVHPILVTKDGMVIDGFHRWMLSKESPELQRKYEGMIPCVELEMSEPQAMMMTVRINRAKGQHVAVRMSSLVNSLVNDWGLTEADLVEGIGATKSEVRLLLAGSLLKTRNLDGYQYSKAWVPIETRLEELKEEEFEREE